MGHNRSSINIILNTNKWSFLSINILHLVSGTSFLLHCQSSLSSSDSTLPMPVTSSFSADSPPSLSMTPIHHSSNLSVSLANPSHQRLSSSMRTDTINYHTRLLLLCYIVFLFQVPFFHYFFYCWFNAAD